jgi:hypothetical protein
MAVLLRSLPTHEDDRSEVYNVSILHRTWRACSLILISGSETPSTLRGRSIFSPNAIFVACCKPLGRRTTRSLFLSAIGFGSPLFFSNSAGLDCDFNTGDDGDDLSTALAIETLAARDMISDEFVANRPAFRLLLAGSYRFSYTETAEGLARQVERW